MRFKRTLAGVGATALLATGIPLIGAPAANAGGGNIMLTETLTASASTLKPGRSTSVRLTVRNTDPLHTQTGRYTITPAYPLEFTRTPGGCYMSGQSAVCTMTVRALQTLTKTMSILVNLNATQSGRYSITGAGTVSINVDAEAAALQKKLKDEGSITTGFMWDTRLYSRSASTAGVDSIKAMATILDACDTGVPWKDGNASAGEVARFLGSRAADIAASYFRKLGADGTTRAGAAFLDTALQFGIALNARWGKPCQDAINFVNFGIGFSPSGSFLNTINEVVLVAMNLGKADYDSAVRSIRYSGCLYSKFPPGQFAYAKWGKWTTWTIGDNQIRCA